MLEANTLLQNRYQIIRPIGQGGMGTVYLAKDLRLDNTVALKESIFNDEKMLKAFEQEARLLAGLRHSALPKVSDHFTEGESTFLVMDYIAGNDLGEILLKRKQRLEPIGKAKPFEVEEVLGWAEQLLDALDYLHTRSSPIIHRDIKPQNLKLAERNQIILLDFGLAKGSAFQMTHAVSNKSIFGYTPAYAPIEQIRGSGTDARSDLYSLAATLYHLLTGQEPPDALHRANAFLEGEADPLPPAHHLNPQIPAKVAELINEAMSQHKNLRPESAQAMLKRLREVRRANQTPGATVKAEPPTLLVPRQETANPAVPYTAPPVQTYPNSYAPQNPYPSDPAPPTPQPQPFPSSPPNYQSNPMAQPQTMQGNQATNLNPPPLTTNVDPAYYSQYSQTPEPRSGARIWWLMLGIVMLLSGIVVAAVYVYQENLFAGSSTPTKNVAPPYTPPANGNKNSIGNSNAAMNAAPNAALTALTAAESYVKIPVGEFMMGIDDHGDNQDVPHLVKLTRPFEMGKYEVTQAQWQALMLENPSNFKSDKSDRQPVENVSWDDVQEFLEKLNALKDGYKYRLPTEAEWEYAARAGSKAVYQDNLDAVAWTGDNSGLKTLNSMEIWNTERENYKKRLNANGCQPHPVGQKKPNKWGLFDMQGNVWEWCADWYAEDYYLASPEANPKGADSGTQKINRGGSWYSQIDRCQMFNRSKDTPSTRLSNLGFRLVRTKS
ncbi:MAG: SUMF1/EgtB/PvdO family nonheme iron enzyme [Acidobacteria bacterium]|nr:SUMF1/EgtB/PvdO family nonheme iron enzyme [Acidobacteriota bacterium]